MWRLVLWNLQRLIGEESSVNRKMHTGSVSKIQFVSARKAVKGSKQIVQCVCDGIVRGKVNEELMQRLAKCLQTFRRCRRHHHNSSVTESRSSRFDSSARSLGKPGER